MSTMSVEGCDTCVEGELARLNGEVTWTTGNPFWAKEESETVIWIVSLYHYDHAGTDPAITSYAVQKALAEAEVRQWEFYTVAVAKADVTPPTHLAVMLETEEA